MRGGPGRHQRWHHRHHGHWDGRPMTLLGWLFRARLQRRLFMWFGFSIFVTGAAVAAVVHLTGRSGFGWAHEQERLRTFIGHQFADVWTDPDRRAALATSAARDLDVDLRVVESGGAASDFGEAPCARPSLVVPVRRGADELGVVRVCLARHGAFNGWFSAWPLAFLLMMLWAGSGRLARRIARPLSELARVAADLGAGKLSSRAHVPWRHSGEIALLADVFNEMADRIERQIADQRELLAGVSHELRTPLARIRLLIELLREGAGPERLDELEREVVEIDGLVGELLASSRLDFAELVVRPLDANEAGRRALERAGLSTDLLQPAADARFEGDPTLIARALANLIENARKHGGGLTRLNVVGRDEAVAFEAEDNGSGLPGDPEQVFQPFRPPADGQPREHGSLGLGLTLVRRIAEAHGGRASAANRPAGGAIVGFEVARRRLTAEELDAPPPL